MQNNYGFGKTVGMDFDGALAKVTAELQKEGFGILTEIDVAATMKKKLDHDMPPYRILGACNPPLAYRAIQAEPEIGLLLPCNVTVRELGQDRVSVGFLDPLMMVGLTGNPQIQPVADEAAQRLQRVRDALGSQA